jgi:hypothetical protein
MCPSDHDVFLLGDGRVGAQRFGAKKEKETLLTEAVGNTLAQSCGIAS